MGRGGTSSSEFFRNFARSDLEIFVLGSPIWTRRRHPCDAATLQTTSLLIYRKKKRFRQNQDRRNLRAIRVLQRRTLVELNDPTHRAAGGSPFKESGFGLKNIFLAQIQVLDEKSEFCRPSPKLFRPLPVVPRSCEWAQTTRGFKIEFSTVPKVKFFEQF